MHKTLKAFGSRQNFIDGYKASGYVHWEKINDETGKVVSRGKGKLERKWLNLLPNLVQRRLPSSWLGESNAVVNEGRNRLAQLMIGTSITIPKWVAVGTGTNGVAAADTALQTLSHYDGANDAKVAASQTLKGQFTARIVAQFGTTEANVNIRELGLFDAANSGNMWARVRVTIDKTASERLNVYWYIAFERRTGLAIKTGASIAATGTATTQTDSTLTFASAVTIVSIENNTGGVLYVKLNEAVTGAGAAPTGYDFRMADGSRVFLNNEEVSVATVHVIKISAGNITLPHNELVCMGW